MQEVNHMKRAFKSRYIKKSAMPKEQNSRISADIDAFNRMKHTAFTWNNQNRQFDDGRSIHLHLKEKYGCNDYFAISANSLAKGIISSQKELRDMYAKDIHDDIVAVKKAIDKKMKYLKSLTAVKDSIINYTKKGYANPKKLRTCTGVTFLPDGRVRVQVFGCKTYYASIYLFEHTWLEPKIRRVKNNIAQMQHKLHRLGERSEALSNDKKAHVCFGTKKRFHDTRLAGETRKRTLYKERYNTLAVSGKHDSRNGNFVFTYDPVAGDLTYKSMSDFNGQPVIFPKVFFPYGQERISDYISSHSGPVAWKIKDCGNAWQITCIITCEEDTHKNNCFSDGCVSFDMNYDNISWSELDRQGNLLRHGVLPLDMEGRTKGQIRQQISHALEKIFKQASGSRKPVACESIKSIQRKKFYDKNRKRTRHISMFACSAMEMFALSKSEKYCICLQTVNPAYTSQTGKLKYKRRYGLTVHESAAFVIGRRAMGFVDKVPDILKHYIPEAKRSLPRMKQWSALYAALKKTDPGIINHILYPKKTDMGFLYASEL